MMRSLQGLIILGCFLCFSDSLDEISPVYRTSQILLKLLPEPNLVILDLVAPSIVLGVKGQQQMIPELYTNVKAIVMSLVY